MEALEASSSTLPPSQASYMGWIRTGGTRFRFFLPHMVAIRFIREAFKNVLAENQCEKKKDFFLSEIGG